MKIRKVTFFCCLLILFPPRIYAALDNISKDKREKTMVATLDAMEIKSRLASLAKVQPAAQSSNQPQNKMALAFSSGWEKYKQIFNFGDAYVSVGAKIGYISGDTTYDFNHHTSELEFPMNNWMAGGDISVGLKDLSLNAQLWGQIEENAGYDMKDKDWNSAGALISYTKSKADMNAFIWDLNFRYDFYKTSIPWENELLVLSKTDQIKIGALAGYRHERFGYEMFDLKYPDLNNIVLYPGQRVLTYKIKYSLPYVGLVTEITNPKYGFNFNVKYSFKATAEDQDNHVLRYLTFYGDYDKHGYGIMGGVSGFLKVMENWKINFGVDGEVIRIKGTTWEENHAPSWDKDQDTDAKYMMFWTGANYRF